VYYIVKAIFQPSNTIRCSRCDGKGFWYDARGKEKCDWCKGSGTLPRDFK
jgi:DnaJ-class molecular chaperone